ncbi:hypothetical protein RhiXN_00899 [Rhizoctonia solani]|uniref:IMD domain-containing protein n=1 Tax=Rhizoctonia solani TaxID=456999 RepID=A0A8H7H9G6_9AGAM|nr:uncharacterized protein RhiXN_00899 [Rhizoctonia solani]KAF8679893.1 hypothetical protein RHS04_04123 [Rhizoctonia solani]QRW19493.1 hypothetical protein RhiXN_00899 [Rhizoctonia solani]
MSGMRVRTRSLSSTQMLGSTRPTSPTYSVTTNTTDARDLAGRAERIITKADLKASAEAYEQLINASRFFRDALAGVSRASAKFAEAIEKCSRLKGPSDACGKDLQAAAGLHHLISNHEQILEHTIVHKFEIPLRQELQAYKAAVAERTAEYERASTEKSRLIQKTEADNMRVGRKKLRDLNSFRAALASLQAQVNDLDKLKSDYYQQVLEHEQQIWDGVLGNVSVVVRSTMDVYDRITAKASDPSLEHILASVPDPFDEYASQAPAPDAIFSILAPLEIMSGVKTPGETTAPGSASSSAGNSNSGGGLTSAPPSENGLNAWIDKHSEWTENTRRYSLPLMGSSGSSSSGTGGYPTSQSQHLPYAVAASSPLASPPLIGMIEGVRRREGSGGSGFGSREPSVERHEDAGGWASYALPPRSRVQSMERGPTLLSQASAPTLNANGRTGVALDGPTPTAPNFSISETGNGDTVGKEGEKDDAASESGTTVVAAGTDDDRKTIR